MALCRVGLHAHKPTGSAAASDQSATGEELYLYLNTTLSWVGPSLTISGSWARELPSPARSPAGPFHSESLARLTDSLEGRGTRAAQRIPKATKPNLRPFLSACGGILGPPVAGGLDTSPRTPSTPHPEWGPFKPPAKS